MKLSADTEKFLRSEAKRLFKSLSFIEQRRIQSYKKIYFELKQAWKDTKNHITPENIGEFVKKN